MQKKHKKNLKKKKKIYPKPNNKMRKNNPKFKVLYNTKMGISLKQKIKNI